MFTCVTPMNKPTNLIHRFFASQNMDIPFAIFPHRVDEEGFINCDISRGKPIVPQPSKEPIAVLEEFLRPGVNYFISELHHLIGRHIIMTRNFINDSMDSRII